jgi:hypothetical protein
MERLNINKSKFVCSLLSNHFKLSSKHFPSNEGEINKMKKVCYSPTISSLMYNMVCTMPKNIAYVASVDSSLIMVKNIG